MAPNLQVRRTRECEPEGARAKEGVDAGEAADQGQAHAQAQPQPDPPRVGPGLIKMSERQSDVHCYVEVFMVQINFDAFYGKCRCSGLLSVTES